MFLLFNYVWYNVWHVEMRYMQVAVSTEQDFHTFTFFLAHSHSLLPTYLLSFLTSLNTSGSSGTAKTSTENLSNNIEQEPEQQYRARISRPSLWARNDTVTTLSVISFLSAASLEKMVFQFLIWRSIPKSSLFASQLSGIRTAVLLSLNTYVVNLNARHLGL